MERKIYTTYPTELHLTKATHARERRGLTEECDWQGGSALPGGALETQAGGLGSGILEGQLGMRDSSPGWKGPSSVGLLGEGKWSSYHSVNWHRGNREATDDCREGLSSGKTTLVAQKQVHGAGMEGEGREEQRGDKCNSPSDRGLQGPQCLPLISCVTLGR